MGKIKSKQIRKTARIINEKLGIEGDFNENKKTLNGLTQSKKVRNQIAGLLAKKKKRETTNQ